MTIEIITQHENDYLDRADPFLITRDEAMADCMIYKGRGGGGNKPMQRGQTDMRRKRMIAYDLETTNICEGTPTIKYLTAFAGEQDLPHGKKTKHYRTFRLSATVRGETRQAALQHYLFLLETELLIREHNRARFVAWNGNRYDALLTAQAILLSDDWQIQPYLTKAKTVRGMRVVGLNHNKGLSFEFLDGMAMTGLDTVAMPLAKFLKLYAPSYSKLALDFSQTEFDADNAEHVAYADRDSEGLWYAMQACNIKMIELTGNELQATMGRAAIYYLMSQMPAGKQVWRPPTEAFEIIHERAKRGGYVWISRQYKGPVWKYDLNQAYAGAMRDCQLPCGAIMGVDDFQPGAPGVYRCTIERETLCTVPFYYKDAASGAANFTNGKSVSTWIFSNEIEHLRRDHWRLTIHEGYVWADHFNLAAMVNNLERMRFSDPAGPSGPLGIMVKTIGNSAYGKTLERVEGLRLVLARQCPAGFIKYAQLSDAETVFAKDEGQSNAPYHQPQIGSFITAHVRVQVREAAIAMPDQFIYADTDCVVFSAPAKHLEISPTRYGAWKAETEGVDYCFIGKKVYSGSDGSKHAKGMRRNELTDEDFANWFEGRAPVQKQLQRANFLKMAAGNPMFKTLTRRGTDIRALKTVLFDGEKFTPL